MGDGSMRRERTHTVWFRNGEESVEPDEANRAIVRGPEGCGYIELKWPRDRSVLDTLEKMLLTAEAMGSNRARSEIRAALGIEDAPYADN